MWRNLRCLNPCERSIESFKTFKEADQLVGIILNIYSDIHRQESVNKFTTLSIRVVCTVVVL